MLQLIIERQKDLMEKPIKSDFENIKISHSNKNANTEKLKAELSKKGK